jgi:hypothetical protein
MNSRKILSHAEGPREYAKGRKRFRNAHNNLIVYNTMREQLRKSCGREQGLWEKVLELQKEELGVLQRRFQTEGNDNNRSARNGHREHTMPKQQNSGRVKLK